MIFLDISDIFLSVIAEIYKNLYIGGHYHGWTLAEFYNVVAEGVPVTNGRLEEVVRVMRLVQQPNNCEKKFVF